MTLPFLIVFFAEICVNSHQPFYFLWVFFFFLWGEDLPVRDDDNDDVFEFSVRLYSSGYSSQVPTF